MRSLVASSLATLVLGGSLLACTSPATSEGIPEDLSFVDEGKADDFLSVSAREYIITGRTSVTLDASWSNRTAAEKRKEVTKLIGYKQIALAWFLTQYLVDKEDSTSFGGFGGMAKAGAYEDFNVAARADGLTYDFDFKQLAAGGVEMLERLPLRTEGGKKVFDLEVGTPTNDEIARLETNSEWYRNAPWSDWNPANVPASKKQKLTFTIAREKDSPDGYIDLERLTADGKLDIDIHFGWDYHSEYHIKFSQKTFTWLKAQGFRAPVANWNALTPTSGAFTKKMKANGEELDVEVRLFYGKPGTSTDPDTDAGGRVLEAAAMESLATRDVIMYSGHSGPFYGFALANWKKTAEGDLDDDDIRVAPMPADRYQLVLANGCDTYQIGTAFKENPNKNGKNIDVITSTSFSNAGTNGPVEEFLTHLLSNKNGVLEPREVSGLLTRMDRSSYGFDTMYGMHGIDDNPKLVPFANTQKFGQACTTHAQCGGPGNFCVGSSGSKKCTAACTADAGCGDNGSCKTVANLGSSTVYGKACSFRAN